MYRKRGKRILDVMLAVMGLITSLPLFVVLPVVLCVYFNGNPFYIQRRPGLNGRIFQIVKFRTMCSADGEIPALGKWLRKTSLDEIPQFWNVLKGDMSIVGPRPLLTDYLAFYTETQHLRHSVKPGITGLAQISGRNRLDWNEKFAHDLNYVQELSFMLDLQIICKTVGNALLFRHWDAIEALPFKGNTAC